MLTAAGRILREQGPQLLAQRTALISRAQAALSSPRGIVKVVSDLGFPPALNAQLMALCVKTYPDVQMRIHLSDAPLGAMQDDHDLAIYWGEGPPARATRRSSCTPECR